METDSQDKEDSFRLDRLDETEPSESMDHGEVQRECNGTKLLEVYINYVSCI